AAAGRKVLEGVFAINKPQWASSAGVLRDLQTEFATAELFQPWFEATRRQMLISGSKKKHMDQLKVKLGHGGTLDPMATGVLVVGVGKGTKELGKFLECTKSYECTVLFGAATDSYDAVGKIVSRADYAHVTRELVEEKLAAFRGDIMQKPSIFSALKVDGKKMYEYAREGKDIPAVPARPVTVEKLELVEWLEPGTHEYAWPSEELDEAGKAGAEKLLGIRASDAAQHQRNAKRGRSPASTSDQQSKKPRTESEPAPSASEPAAATATSDPAPSAESHAPQIPTEIAQHVAADAPRPPAARLRMTVTSGFYVRSLCHDLGLACGSLALMSTLVRSRQGAYELRGADVLEYDDLGKGSGVWQPKVTGMLERFMEREGWVAEEVEADEEWEARKKEVLEARREGDRGRSYKGGRGKYRGGGGGGGRYSKGMDGG
ncbi:pseudouridine synthase, partial [Boeremia exigua]|uniref:pseudouridine synthase n=1 Tax=Boeremia exigua TaxID=749465 RepID=UPI001E8D3DBD